MPINAERLETALRTLGVLPVVTVAGADKGLALAGALCAGGLPAIEITFRVDGAVDALKAVARAHPEMLVGAGTVRSAAQAKIARDAGASFLVSPGLVPEVAAFAIAEGMAYLPGTATPSEMEAARGLGLSFLKLFPAEVVGGRGMLRAVQQAMPDFRFVPTGGVTLESMADYLGIPNVVAVGGSWIAPNADIASNRWQDITQRAVSAREKAASARSKA